MFGMKIEVILAIAGICTLVVGGFWLYQRDLVKGLQDKVTSQQEQIAGVTAERDTANGNLLVASNQIITQQKEFNKAIEELAILRASDSVAKAKLEEEQRLLNDEKNKSRVAAVLNKKADLTIDLIDKQIACETKNFYNTDGKCVRGEYVKDGARLVPVVLPVSQTKDNTPTKEITK